MFLGSILECFLLSVSKFQELTFLILFHVWASSFLIILAENQMIVVVWMYFWVLWLFYLICYCCCSFCISAMLTLLLWIRSIIWIKVLRYMQHWSFCIALLWLCKYVSIFTCIHPFELYGSFSLFLRRWPLELWWSINWIFDTPFFHNIKLLFCDYKRPSHLLVSFSIFFFMCFKVFIMKDFQCPLVILCILSLLLRLLYMGIFFYFFFCKFALGYWELLILCVDFYKASNFNICFGNQEKDIVKIAELIECWMKFNDSAQIRVHNLQLSA